MGDRICFCGMPDEQEKLNICEVQAKNHNLSSESGDADLPAALRTFIAKIPPRFSSADISALFSSAKIEAVNEVIGSAPQGGARRTPTLTMSHLYQALSTAKASISEADERRYDKVFAPYRPEVQPNALSRDGSEAQNQGGSRVALA